jgi:glutathione synthase/RimK-type ligase-like ATP-grasp enzyme
MKNVAILGAKDYGEKNNAVDLAKSFSESSSAINFQAIYWEDLLFDISKDSQSVVDTVSGQDLSSFDLVFALNWYRNDKDNLYREAALTLALYLSNKNVKFWNEEILKQRSSSKLSAMMQLALLNLDIPKTKFSISKEILKSGNDLGFPLILKAAQASRGRDNYLVKDLDELSAHLDKPAESNKYIVQEYIKNDADLRVICANMEPRLVLKRSRVSEESHLNNTSKGADAELIELNTLNADIIQACRIICREMGRNIAGIDLMFAKDSDRYVFLEVNSIPQLSSGVFLDEKANSLALAIEQALEGEK